MKKLSPKFLLIDAGNTRVKWATAAPQGPIRVAGETATKEISSGRIRALSHQFPQYSIVLTSVVPKLTPMFRKAFSGRLIEVSAALPELSLRFDYLKPAEIGADRLAAAVAAQDTGTFPTIIVACGTATAFTVLDRKGRFCGGVIAPGLLTQLDALSGATAQLPAITLRAPRSALARSTSEAIRGGVLLNFQGGIKEIIHELTKSLPVSPPPHIILTGGNARYLAGKLDFPIELRPLLVFEGLRIIASRRYPSA